MNENIHVMESALNSFNMNDSGRDRTVSYMISASEMNQTTAESPEQASPRSNHPSTFDPSPPSSSPEGSRKSGVLCLDDDYDDVVDGCGGRCAGRVLFCQNSFFLDKLTVRTAAKLYFLTGFLILLTGLSLLIVSTKTKMGQPQLPQLNTEIVQMTAEETKAYWLRLRNTVMTSIMVPSSSSSSSSSLSSSTNTSANNTNDGVVSAASSRLLQPGSAMWHALQWMVLKDPLRPLPLDDDTRVLQRFTLATLYYEWSGSRWILLPKDGWLHTTTVSSTDIPNSTELLLLEPGNVAAAASDDEEAQYLYSPAYHECDWHGVECDSEKRVISLVLNGDDSGITLVGTVPSILTQLNGLQKLHLVNHLLRGDLPSEFEKLQNLTSLDLSRNKLTTFNFQAILSWQLLENLNLSDNQLQTNISQVALNQLTNLRSLDLSGNDKLHGDPFAIMLDWPKLQHLNVGSTKCAGLFPSRIHQLTDLETLTTQFVSLDGTIPDSIASCTKLRELNLRGNENPSSGLVGTVPTAIGELLHLETLDLSLNRLQTTLPTEFGTMNNLAFLNFHLNRGVIGTLPTELGLLSNSLLTLNVRHTSLTGSVPEEYNQLTKLETFDIVGTKVSVTLSEEFCNIESLSVWASCTSETCSCCRCNYG